MKSPLTWAKQQYCGRENLGGGHHMDVEIVISGDTFIADPVITCDRCGLVPPEHIQRRIMQTIEEHKDYLCDE